MGNSKKDIFILLSLYAFALLSWYAVYHLEILSFWFGTSVNIWLLGTLSSFYNGLGIKEEDINIKSSTIGISSGLLLFVLFYVGSLVFKNIFPEIYLQLFDITELKEQTSVLMASLCIVFITSPNEELFWRGYVQKKLSEFVRPTIAIVLSTLLYASVLIITGNVLLILAALVAGFYWALLFEYTKNLYITIISHAVWALGAFFILL